MYTVSVSGSRLSAGQSNTCPLSIIQQSDRSIKTIDKYPAKNVLDWFIELRESYRKPARDKCVNIELKESPESFGQGTGRPVFIF